ncbi:hypothetical protein ACKLNO_05905 [Neisseriaceae bacterium B1]
MQKFILLRGHEGSGKSTFAVQKIAEFLHDYPNAHIVHIDNDLALTDAQGAYHFDFEKFSAAHQRNMATQQAAFEQGWRAPERDMLVINANPNQKAKTCFRQLDMAKAHGFVCEVYRLHNFFPNIHHVAEEDVLRGYLRLNANPIDKEIHVAAVCEMSAAQRAKLRELG